MYLVNQVHGHAPRMVSPGSSDLNRYNFDKYGYLVNQIDGYASGMVSLGSFELMGDNLGKDGEPGC